MRTISVNILGHKRSQRYVIWRAIIHAQIIFEKENPGCRLDVKEVKTAQEILQFTPVTAFPSLRIGEKLVCVGRFPTSDEVLGWLESEIQKEPVNGST